MSDLLDEGTAGRGLLRCPNKGCPEFRTKSCHIIFSGSVTRISC